MALKTSAWRAERNRKALARLTKALPAIFPAPVLTYALKRAFIPPTPRLAIESYWRSHPFRADRLARALAARTGPPVGWTWRISPRTLRFVAPLHPHHLKLNDNGVDIFES